MTSPTAFDEVTPPALEVIQSIRRGPLPLTAPNRTPLSHYFHTTEQAANGASDRQAVDARTRLVASLVHSAQAIQRPLPGRTPARPGESSDIAGENVGGFQLRAPVGGHDPGGLRRPARDAAAVSRDGPA